jgi:hypothetical protein
MSARREQRERANDAVVVLSVLPAQMPCDHVRKVFDAQAILVESSPPKLGNFRADVLSSDVGDESLHLDGHGDDVLHVLARRRVRPAILEGHELRCRASPSSAIASRRMKATPVATSDRWHKRGNTIDIHQSDPSEEPKVIAMNMRPISVADAVPVSR